MAKVKMLRSLGSNLVEANPGLGNALAAGNISGPLWGILEHQVREFPDEFAQALIGHGLAEDSDEALTELPDVPKAAKQETTPPAAEGKKESKKK